jgi:hypothetical protein
MRRTSSSSGNVGEEGEGDLRARQVLAEARQIQGQIKTVLAVDGPDQSLIANAGVGSSATV